MPEKEVMTVGEVAEMLGVHRATLWRWLRQGVGPQPIDIPGAHRRFRRVDVLAWLATRGKERKRAQ